MKSEDEKKRGEGEKKRSSGPFPPMFMRRGVAVGNGRMVLRPRLCARGCGDSSHAESGCGGRGRCWRQAGRAIATRSGLLMSDEKSMPTRELLHLGAEVAGLGWRGGCVRWT